MWSLTSISVMRLKGMLPNAKSALTIRSKLGDEMYSRERIYNAGTVFFAP